MGCGGLPVRVQVRLFPPLNSTAGRSLVQVSLDGQATIQTVIDALVEEYGPEFRRHLYDVEEQIIPAWSVFVGGRPVQLNRPENLSTPIEAGDEVAFILNIAGG
jgi:molybdopterin converting factor small subunit